MSYKEQLCFDMNDGNKLPAIGYGSWQATEGALEKALNAALEVGYRLIDTAAAYLNEEVIGKVLSEWFDAGKLKREDIFVVTKLPFNRNRASSVESTLKESLRKLKLDYVDLYLIHGPFGCVDGEEAMPKDENGKMMMDMETDHISLWKVSDKGEGAMEDQVTAGRAKSIGVSNFSQKQIERILNNSTIPPANLQIELHLYFQQKPLVEFCKSKNISITSYSSLGTPGTLKTFGVEIPSFLDHEDVKRIAEKYEKSTAQIALRFIVQQGIAIIPKSVTATRITENFKITDFALDDDDMKALKALDLGENGRLLVFHQFLPGVEEHPEYSFPVNGA